MNLSMERETTTEELVSLRRELAHVSEQCRVAHSMAMEWRQRCLASEEHCRRLQKKLDRKRDHKNAGTDTSTEEDIQTDEALSLPAVW
jgi:hypothetical protein